MSRRIALLWSLILIALVVMSACGAPQTNTDPLAEGQRMFTIWCSGCHALDPNGPVALGPGLAGIATRAADNPDGLTAAEWLMRETVNPNITLAPGYAPGLMPGDYGQRLRPEQLDAIVAFMLTLTE
ncbi:MAG: c-type cytochrome [Oscillochloridaceae bacterium umkhey_bin13]